MKISDKNALWTKYLLIEEDVSSQSLKRFVIHEVDVMNMDDKASLNKKKKTLRYMLKSLSKHDILKYYSSDITIRGLNYLHLSKNEIIDVIIKSTILWDL